MGSFTLDEYTLSPNTKLTIIDIENIDEDVKKLLDDNFVAICEGNSGADLTTVKAYVRNLFSTKTNDWIMGAIAEFFIHLYIRYTGFRQECLFLNLEENSIKKGFDGFYSKNGVGWLMESKAGSVESKSVSHASKVSLAMQDLSVKVSGTAQSSQEKIPNNPWREAYYHANLYDVGTAQNIRKNIKRLADEFTNGKFHTIEEFNTMPCGTVFLSGVWEQPNHALIQKDIQKISGQLKGARVHVICATHQSVTMFKDYLEAE